MKNQDKELVERAFAGGPAVLIDAGMTPAQIAEFLGRTDVVQYMQALASEMEKHEGLMTRARFMARRMLARHVTDAVGVIRAALRGPLYMRNPDGSIMFDKFLQMPKIREMAPTTNQQQAAQDLLDRIGVAPKQDLDNNAALSVNILFDSAAAKDKLAIGPQNMTEEQKAQWREQIRDVMDTITAKLVDKKKAKMNGAKKVKAKVQNAPQLHDGTGGNGNGGQTGLQTVQAPKETQAGS